MTYPLAKLDDAKAALGFGGDAHDAELLTLLLAATATAERLVGVELRRVVDREEFPRALVYGARSLRLERWPVERVESVQQQFSAYAVEAHVWESTEPLDVRLYTFSRLGLLEFVSGFRTFGMLPQSTRVVYTAGYADPAVDPETLPVTALQPPEDLQRGIVVEVVRLWNTKGDAGLGAVDGGKAGRNAVDQSAVHEQLAAACDGLRRLTL